MQSRGGLAFSGIFRILFSAVFCASVLLSGCASSREGDGSSGSPAPQHEFAALPQDCACTLEFRSNLCVTVNGQKPEPDPGSDSLRFVRERQDGTWDVSSPVGSLCFGELRGVQRVLMLRDTIVVDSSGWFEIRTVDCCHGEAKTVDFAR